MHRLDVDRVPRGPALAKDAVERGLVAVRGRDHDAAVTRRPEEEAGPVELALQELVDPLADPRLELLRRRG